MERNNWNASLTVGRSCLPCILPIAWIAQLFTEAATSHMGVVLLDSRWILLSWVEWPEAFQVDRVATIIQCPEGAPHSWPASFFPQRHKRTTTAAAAAATAAA
jgi:hypothetical protein